VIVPLELTGLTRVFSTPTGPFVAVKDVNARILAGTFVAILGHSGCGKSTVLSILAGLDKATYGGVIIDGTEVTEPGPERAIVFQSPCLLPWLNVLDNVVVAATQGSTRRTKKEALELARFYLDIVGISDCAMQMPNELSLGTQQCVSLARALVVEPRFLLLDEPFSQLDSLTRFELQDLLLRVWEAPPPHRASVRGGDPGSGNTVIMVTHDIDEALYLADHLVLMTDGPEATVGDVYTVPFARPRTRATVLAHPRYHEARRHVIDFLEHHAHQSRPSALDQVLAKRLA
jgi:ABC-type nitrate/sulfonate/bicarbonate transport system ATPase subunit